MDPIGFAFLAGLLICEPMDLRVENRDNILTARKQSDFSILRRIYPFDFQITYPKPRPNSDACLPAHARPLKSIGSFDYELGKTTSDKDSERIGSILEATTTFIDRSGSPGAIVIEGHADTTGRPPCNLRLSLARGMTFADQLYRRLNSPPIKNSSTDFLSPSQIHVRACGTAASANQPKNDRRIEIYLEPGAKR